MDKETVKKEWLNKLPKFTQVVDLGLQPQRPAPELAFLTMTLQCLLSLF